MPLSFNDAFVYEDSDLLPWFQSEGIYQSDLFVWRFYHLGSGDYSYLEKLLKNIKSHFPNAPDSNEWIDEVLSHLLEEWYWFEFYTLDVLLGMYAKVNKQLLYTCIEKTAKELYSDNFDKLRIIFNWQWSNFGFFGYYHWPRWDDALSKSLALHKKPNPSDEHKTVIDWVIEDVHWIHTEIQYHRWVTAINEKWVIVDDTISVVSSLITGLIHINKSPTIDDSDDEIPF